MDTNLGFGKNNSNDADEGWVNAKNISVTDGSQPAFEDQPPTRTVSNYSVRIYNVDDLATVYVNGSKIVDVRFNRTESRDITNWLRPGNNEVRFVLQNYKDGFTYGFEMYQNNNSIFKDECGKAGYSGCKRSSQTGVVFDRTVNVDF